MSTAEQTSASKREPGYYWVRRKPSRGGNWIVAQYRSIDMWLDPYYTELVADEFWQEIDERRIERGQPDELSKAQARIRELEAVLKFLTYKMQDSGVEGCTYGDTQYDSMSVAYGYNSCLEEVKKIAQNALRS